MLYLIETTYNGWSNKYHCTYVIKTDQPIVCSADARRELSRCKDFKDDEFITSYTPIDGNLDDGLLVGFHTGVALTPES